MRWGGVGDAKRDECWEWLAAGLGVSAPTTFHHKSVMGLPPTRNYESKLVLHKKHFSCLRLIETSSFITILSGGLPAFPPSQFPHPPSSISMRLS